jgi:hypothetical protein
MAAIIEERMAKRTHAVKKYFGREYFAAGDPR